MDPKIEKIAKQLLHYSVDLQKGERVLIESDSSAASPLVKALVREAYRMGGLPFVRVDNMETRRELLMHANEQQISLMAETHLCLMEAVDACVGIKGGANPWELSDIPKTKMTLYQAKFIKPVYHDCCVESTKWVTLRYPSQAMSQALKKSREATEKFCFSVCNLNYARLAEAMKPLVSLMEKTDRVRITGPGTDLSFSIRGIPAIPCAGEFNIPDGEIFTAPEKTSVNGALSINTSTFYQGTLFTDISFTLRDGKIVEASANEQERLDAILNMDEGARFIGEFAIGLNPFITEPMQDTLYDEKIAGSFHLTPGGCYDEACNGNNSAIHWDMVVIQRPEWGGGEIFFDDKLIRKDGLFVTSELEGLNPENLKRVV